MILGKERTFDKMLSFFRNKKTHFFLLTVCLFIIADQGVKCLLANHTVIGQTTLPITDFFRIRPLINERTTQALLQLSEKWSLPYELLLFANIAKRLVFVSAFLTLAIRN